MPFQNKHSYNQSPCSKVWDKMGDTCSEGFRSYGEWRGGRDFTAYIDSLSPTRILDLDRLSALMYYVSAVHLGFSLRNYHRIVQFVKFVDHYMII